MTYIKLQIAGNIYYTKVTDEELEEKIEFLTSVLQKPAYESVISYEAEDSDLKTVKQLVFKESALEAFAVMR